MVNEIGFEEMTKTIFFVNEKNELIERNYFEGTLPNLHLTEKGYDKIINYLNNNSFQNMDILLIILSSLAYGHPSEKMKKTLAYFITKNKDIIFNNIDTLENIIEIELNKEKSQVVQSIIDMEMSFNLLETLSNIINFMWRGFDLYKKEKLYGLGYLFLYLSKYCHNDFEEWFLKTKSNKLKIIYTNEQLDSLNIFDIEEVYINSKINFVRGLAKLVIYVKEFKLTDNQKSIMDLEPNEENVYFTIFSLDLKYYGKLYKDDIDKLNKRLIEIKEYLQFLSPSIIKEFLIRVDTNILYGMVNEVINQKQRFSIYDELLKYLDTNIDLLTLTNFEKIEEANIYGAILFEIDDEQRIIEIKNKFDIIFKEIDEPYYFYRFHNDWRMSLNKLLYYLIVIFIYYSNKDKRDTFLIYKEKINNIKKDFEFFKYEQVNNLLEQIV